MNHRNPVQQARFKAHLEFRVLRQHDLVQRNFLVGGLEAVNGRAALQGDLSDIGPHGGISAET